MSLMERFATMTFNCINDVTEDEYQEHTLLRAMTVAYYTIPLSNYTIGAILAWCLPGKLALFSLLLLVPLAISEFFANSWLKGKTPRPKAQTNRVYLLATLIPCVAWVAGLSYNRPYPGGFISGAVIGGIAAAVALPPLLAHRNAKDKKRIESSLKD